MEDVYKKLAVHLDNTPGGYPASESGVELRILKQLFTPKEAELDLSLVMMPESVDTIAQRADKSPEQILPILIEMGQKGLIIHLNRDGQDSFMLAQFVVGIWEYQVNRLTPELIADFNEYVPDLIKTMDKTKTQQLRVVPVTQSVTTELNIMDHEHLEALIKTQSKILIAPCICRKEHTMINEGCGKMEEACLIFGGGAFIYESRGIGRTISQEEAIEIVKKGISQGLVAQPSNSIKPINICLCCDCCCQILSNIKKTSAPARIVNSNYQATVDQELCTGCQVCEDICPMDAIQMDEENILAKTDTDRCIGCGLCVTVCEFDAMALKNKENEEQWEPPQTIADTYMNIAKEKGLF
ncbi:MAG: 4Fe-4S dicluster domain-containing protein [Desulfobacteraceae bacterium]|nr:4Fe-4S dicluster domain-containing protein [Desulfobacteraceae bacterium]